MLARLSLGLLGMLLTAAAAHAQDAQDTLCTDRPGKVYATCVLDPGRFQLETDLASGSFQRQGGVTTDTWLVTNPTLKYGVAKDFELEVNLAPYVVVRTHDRDGEGGTLGGVGDLYLRAKYQAWSAGPLTVSVLPYVKAPLAREGIGNGEVEGGGVAAIGWKFNDQWSLSLSPELDDYADAEGTGRHLNHVEVVSVARSLPHDVTVNAELWGDWEYDPSGTVRQYSADVSASWAVTHDFQLDAGMNLGLNHATPGFEGYVGLSQRF